MQLEWCCFCYWTDRPTELFSYSPIFSLRFSQTQICALRRAHHNRVRHSSCSERYQQSNQTKQIWAIGKSGGRRVLNNQHYWYWVLRKETSMKSEHFMSRCSQHRSRVIWPLRSQRKLNGRTFSACTELAALWTSGSRIVYALSSYRTYWDFFVLRGAGIMTSIGWERDSELINIYSSTSCSISTTKSVPCSTTIMFRGSWEAG